MSCKSAIYTANTSAYAVNLTAQQPVSSIPLGSIIRRYGRNIDLSGNGMLLSGEGYYDVEASVTLTPAAAGSAIAFNIPALVRLQCCDSASTLALVLSTSAALPAAVVVNNVGVVVEKV